MGQTKQASDNILYNIQNKCETNTQSGQNEKKHKCTYPECQAEFSKFCRLQSHIRVHTGERPYTCDYPGCKKSYTNSSHLKRHAETHSLIEKKYPCRECSQIISTLHNLKRHYARKHNEDRKITCKECGQTFNKKCQLAKHQTEHYGSVTYKCDKCTKAFTVLSRLKKHEETHNKTYPCPVPECSEIFNKWLLLRKHKKLKHKTEHKCDHCGKVFYAKSQLNFHSKIHSENRMIIPCPYDKCHRAYFFKSNLKNHIKIKHLGEKFYCNICSVGRTSKARLIEHIQSHYKLERKRKTSNKVRQKKRKDTGISKKSEVSKLIGMTLPHDLEKIIIKRNTVIKTLESSEY